MEKEEVKNQMSLKGKRVHQYTVSKKNSKRSSKQQQEAFILLLKRWALMCSVWEGGRYSKAACSRRKTRVRRSANNSTVRLDCLPCKN